MYNISKPLKDLIKGYGFSQEVEDKIYLWLHYKKEKGQTYKDTGLKSLLDGARKKIQEHGEQYLIDSICNSMENNYQGIYPPRTNKITNPKKISTFNVKTHNYSKEELEGLATDIENVEL